MAYFFCARKISKFETGGVHKVHKLPFIGKNRTDDYKKTLGHLVFPDSETFAEFSAADSYSFQQMMAVFDKAVPYKIKRGKGNTQKWFDGKF